MTIESEIAGLTQATTDLLAAVNVRKATLDQKVAEATTQASAATTKAGEASAAASSASTNATSAANSAGAAANSASQAAAITGAGSGAFGAQPISTDSTLTLGAGTANGVLYLNGSKQATSGSALTFDGTNFTLGNSVSASPFVFGVSGSNSGVRQVGVLAFKTASVSAQKFIDVNVTAGYDNHYDIRFYTDAGTGTPSEQMRLTSTGLGIGTSSPAYKLDVSSGHIRMDDGYRLRWGGGTSAIEGNGASGILSLYTNNAERMRLDSSGNLGLGVTPSAWGTAGSAYKAFQYGISGFLAGRTSNEIAILGTGAYNDGTNWRYTLSGNFASHYSQASGQHTWYTAPSGTAGEAISFTKAMDLVHSAGASTLTVNSATNNASAIRLTTNGALDAGMFLANPTVDHSLGFQTAGSERARIDSSGNLGLGVAPSSWQNGVRAFDIVGGANAGALYSGAGVNLGAIANGYYSSGVFYYKSADAASDYRQEAGTHKWLTAPSGTAGDAISFTQAMTLDADGNLMVGTTTTNYDQFGLKYRADLGLLLSTSNNNYGFLVNRHGTTGGLIDFYHANSGVGDIATNGTSVSYNTSSDYRLKNITGPLQNSGVYIDSLNPVEGTWKADGSTFVGLIAHEVQEVSRTQVATGEKDGEQMQAMDYSNSELIANLIAEVKSLRARVAALESN